MNSLCRATLLVLAHSHLCISWAVPCSGVKDCDIVQVHAACSGVWGFRASSGTGLVDSQGAAAGSLEAVGWACQDPQNLQLVGAALKLPGSERHRMRA